MGLFESMKKVNRIIFLVAAVAVIFMMLLTVADVIMREFKRPIVGTFELVSFAAAVVIGFCIPYTTSVRSHITVDFFTMKMPEGVQRVLRIITRIMGIAFFIFAGYELLLLGRSFQTSGEVSLTLYMPFYPVAYGMGICCFVQAFTQITDLIGILRRQS